MQTVVIYDEEEVAYDSYIMKWNCFATSEMENEKRLLRKE